MDRFIKPRKLLVALQAQPDTVHKAAEVHAPATVVAAWPSGVSQLAQAVNACQRRDTGIDWLQRRRNSIVLPPAF
jgi:hypothetical protein